MGLCHDHRHQRKANLRRSAHVRRMDIQNNTTPRLIAIARLCCCPCSAYSAAPKDMLAEEGPFARSAVIHSYTWRRQDKFKSHWDLGGFHDGYSSRGNLLSVLLTLEAKVIHYALCADGITAPEEIKHLRSEWIAFARVDALIEVVANLIQRLIPLAALTSPGQRPKGKGKHCCR